VESTIIQLIGSLGFPIVACVFLWKFINGTLDSFRQALQQNTAMLAQVCDRLDMWQQIEQEEKEKGGKGREQFPFS
jgi:hypothetical protein